MKLTPLKAALISIAGVAASLTACQDPRPVREDFLDPNYYEVTVDRDAYGHVIFLGGDSILRGFALRKFPDRFTPDEIAKDPRWEQRSPASMINLRSASNGDHPFAVFIGPVGLPDCVNTKLLERIDRRLVREGDMIVIEDAGKHTGTPAAYIEHVESIRRTLCKSGATLLFLNTYDNIAPGTYGGTEEDDLYRWSVPIGGQSMNDALRAAVEAPMPGCKKPLLGDVHAALSGLEQQGIRPVHGDGIHPNVAGQQAIADLILSSFDSAR